jgi:hypothetical protein
MICIYKNQYDIIGSIRYRRSLDLLHKSKISVNSKENLRDIIHISHQNQ